MKRFLNWKGYLGYSENLLRLFVALILAKMYWKVFQFSVFWGLSRKSDKRLVISLATTQNRFNFVKKTIKTLLTQSVPPGSIRVYIESEYVNELREELRSFERFGVEVREGISGIGPGNKLIPELLSKEKDRFIVYCDDDIIYPRKLLASMLRTSSLYGDKTVVCNWAQVCEFNSNGDIKPYIQWSATTRPGILPASAVPLGVAAVLVPRGIAPKKILDYKLLWDLQPFNDDLWNHSAFVMSGTIMTMNHETQRIPIPWPGSQINALWRVAVVGGRGDVSFKRILEIYPGLENELLKNAI